MPILLLCNIAYAAADLEIKTLKGLPAKEFHLEFLVINHGPDPAGHPGCNVYFYANERLVLSQVFNLLPLASGASRKEDLTVDFPNQSITTVKVEVFDSLQADTQPSTNFMQMNIKAADLRKADLQIVEVKSDESKEKERSGFLVRLRNNGPDRIPVSKLRVDLEVFGEVISSSEKRIDRINAGADLETSVQIPRAGVIPATNGFLSFRWIAEEVEDSDPSNNAYKLAITLNLRMPDLLPIKPSVDKQGVLTIAINNKGNARAAATVTALYINGALVERFKTPEIAPRGTSRHRYDAVKLTQEDKIVIVADFNADVQEESEENNRQPQ